MIFTSQRHPEKMSLISSSLFRLTRWIPWLSRSLRDRPRISFRPKIFHRQDFLCSPPPAATDPHSGKSERGRVAGGEIFFWRSAGLYFFLQALRSALPGEPGLVHKNSFERQRGSKVSFDFLQQDYPIFGSVPDTNFNCQGKVHGGYYSDIEAGCQVRTKRSPNTTEYEIRFFTSASKRLTDSAPTASSARMAPSLSRLGTF